MVKPRPATSTVWQIAIPTSTKNVNKIDEGERLMTPADKVGTDVASRRDGMVLFGIKFSPL